MIKVKEFDLIEYSRRLDEHSDNFWSHKLGTDIFNFILKKNKNSDKESLANLRIIINHPYEGDVIIIENKYLFHFIHELSVKTRVKPDQFTIITGNWQIFKQYKLWKKTYFSDMSDINIKVEFILSKIYAPKLFDIPNKNGIVPKIEYEKVSEPREKELIFNCLNKKPSRHRISVYKSLMERQLMHKGIVSFNEVSDTGITGTIPEHLSNQLPIKYDIKDLDTTEKIMNYGDISFTQAIEQSDATQIPNFFKEMYDKTHLSLVTETKLGDMDNIVGYCSYRMPHTDGCDAIMYYNKEIEKLQCPVCDKPLTNPPTPEWVKYYYCGFITEKTFRPLLNAHPFLMVGPRHTLKMLKYLGFKTFDTAWPEDYDNIELPHQRVERVMEVITDLCNKTTAEWQVINKKLYPILKHNQELMENLTEIPTITWSNLWEDYLE